MGASRESGPSAPTDIPPAAPRPAPAPRPGVGSTLLPAADQCRGGARRPARSTVIGLDADDALIYRDTAGRLRTLPAYLPWHRQPEWEPRGRWLYDRPQSVWPDTVVPPALARWIVRAMLLVAVALGAATLLDDRPWRLLTLLALGAVTALWCEWWMRSDLTSVWRRLGCYAVTLALSAAMAVISPLAGLFAWSFYTLCGTFFTGWLALVTLMLAVPIMNATQLGGFDRIPREWPLFVGLYLFCLVVGLFVIAIANKREDAVLRRAAVHAQLLAEQRKSQALQRDLLSRARLDGITAERGRLARELHDTVAQGLVAVVTQLESIPRDSLPAQASERVENAKSLARQGLDEARRAVYALRPIALDQLDLTDAVAALVEAARVETGLDTELRVDGEPRATAHDAALVRIVQEALSNIRRHSAAQRVTVTLTYLDDELLLDIRDDGKGFDPAAAGHPNVDGGHGLPGMAERMALAGGRFTVESEPGAGCVVSAAVPA